MGLPHNRDKARGQQGVTAQFCKKISVKSNGLWRQNLPHRIKQGGFSGCLRLFLYLALHRGRQGQQFESLAIHFATGELWQHLDRLETARNHIGRQFIPQNLAKLPCRNSFARHKNDKSHQFINSRFLTNRHSSMGHTRNMGEFGFNLAQFNTKPAHLDLIINAATKYDIALSIQQNCVTGTIEYRIIETGGKRIRNKFFEGQVIPVQIAHRHAGATDEQLALDTLFDQFQALINNIAAIIGDRLTDGHGFIRINFGNGCNNSGFGWPIRIKQSPPRTTPALGNRGRAGLTTQDNNPQAWNIMLQHGQKGRYSIQNRNSGLQHHSG